MLDKVTGCQALASLLSYSLRFALMFLSSHIYVCFMWKTMHFFPNCLVYMELMFCLLLETAKCCLHNLYSYCSSLLYVFFFLFPGSLEYARGDIGKKKIVPLIRQCHTPCHSNFSNISRVRYSIIRILMGEYYCHLHWKVISKSNSILILMASFFVLIYFFSIVAVTIECLSRRT